LHSLAVVGARAGGASHSAARLGPSRSTGNKQDAHRATRRRAAGHSRPGPERNCGANHRERQASVVAKKKSTRKKASRKKATRKKARRKATRKTTRKKAGRKKASRKKAGRRKVAGRKKKRSSRGRPSSLSKMTTADLTAELSRRKNQLPALRREHSDLLDQLSQVEAEIAEIESAAGAGAGAGASAPARGRRRGSGRGPGRPKGSGAGRKRPRNEQNLEDTLAETLRGKTMSVTEATDAVQANGYKTSAANFRTIVNATLLKSPKIKRVARGQYTAK